MKVAAAVVTYNRHALLARCLEALRAQSRPVDRLVVVDNASTDGTAEMLAADPALEHVRLPGNTGGAGGFAVAIDTLRAGEADWLWVMDDDAEPRPDALERLLAAPEAADARTSALCPKVVFADGTLDLPMRGHFRRRLRYLPPAAYEDGEHPELGFTSFVGPLVRAAAARRLDLPRAEFFVWGDDVEYSLRLRTLGRLVLVPEAVVVHHATSHGAYTTPRSRALNAVSPVKFAPTPLERFWQNLFGIRNIIWVKRAYEGQGPLSAAGTALQFMVKHGLWDDRPLTRIRWIARFARDGRRGRFVNVPPGVWAERARRGEL